MPSGKDAIKLGRVEDITSALPGSGCGMLPQFEGHALLDLPIFVI